MADTADVAAQIVEDMLTDAVRRARNAILAGTAGECEQCEWWMPRLVDGRCGFCRDGRPRPPDWEPPPRPDEPPQEPTRETTMAQTKTIMLPAFAAAAISGVEKHAKDHDMTIGAAAAALIERGLVPPADASPAASGRVFELEEHLATLGGDVLLGELTRRMTSPPELARAQERAEAAEAEVAALRQEVAEASSRAATATAKLAAMRAALDA